MEKTLASKQGWWTHFLGANKWKGYVFGIVVAIVMTFLSYIILWGLGWWPENESFSTGLFIIVAGINLAYWFVNGLIWVEIAHKGVPLLFGERRENKILDEGWSWYWPWPFGTASAVDIRSLTVPFSRGNEKVRVLTENNVDMSIDGSIIYAVVNPFFFLSVGGKDFVEQNLVATAVKVLREIASTGEARYAGTAVISKDDAVVGKELNLELGPRSGLESKKITITEIVGEPNDDGRIMVRGEISVIFRKTKVIKDVQRFSVHEYQDAILLDDSSPGMFSDGDIRKVQTELGKTVEEAVDAVSGDWGVDVKKVLVTEILPTDKKFVEAQEKQRREEYERMGEETEREHFIGSVKKIANDLGISTTEAALYFQAERDKATRIVVEGEAGDFTKGNLGVEAMRSHKPSGGKKKGE